MENIGQIDIDSRDWILSLKRTNDFEFVNQEVAKLY
jgi:hypothetical protein